LIAAGMVAKDEKLIWVEDEAPEDKVKALSIKLIKTWNLYKAE